MQGLTERFYPPLPSPPSSFLCLSQESSRRASARRRDSFQPKDLGCLDPCDKHRDEEEESTMDNSQSRTCSGRSIFASPITTSYRTGGERLGTGFYRNNATAAKNCR
ncbi:hypothetical protein CFBP6625_07610 [Agrobacterium tumefaciens]|nr:hypothetical protein CFBP6625_07610 [Agrobacterium tumefaciens]